MMIEYVDDALSVYPDAIIHLVNKTGLCRCSLSNTLKKSWKDYFKQYTRLCLRHQYDIGGVYAYPLDVLFGTRYIFTLVIKNHWQETLQPEILKQSLKMMMLKIKEHHISSFAISSLEKPAPEGWLERELSKLQQEMEITCLQKIYII